ncbi:hypothetical protein CEE39_02600 [bacterium (candidate division B38) B3_B38]|nr:MAG: hypothetical protein CEE39_02600 [bacterium (candidate division B38) B3_B38]
MKKWSLLILTLLSIFMISTLLEPQVAGRVKLPPQVRVKLDNGLQLIMVEDHELELFTVALLIKSGATFDPQGKAGLANITNEMLRLGTTHRSSEEIDLELDSIGASLSISSNWDGTYVSINAISRKFDQALDIFSDVVLNPTFPEKELDILKSRRLGEIKVRKDRARTIASENFYKLLFGKHPYAQPLAGTEESVSSISREDILSFYQKFFIPNNAVMVVAGDINPQQVKDKIAARLNQWKKGKLPEGRWAPVAPPKGLNIYLIDKPDLTQTEIRMGHLGISRDNKDYFPLQVMNYILGGGGFSSRLMKHIRSERGYTYGISSGYSARKLVGPFLVFTFTPNKTTINVIQESLEIVKDIHDNGITPEELASAKNYLISSYPSRFETIYDVATQIWGIELYGLGEGYVETYQAKIDQVTLEDVKRVAKQYLDPSNMLIVVVSKAEEVKSDLESMGKVEVIPFSES